MPRRLNASNRRSSRPLRMPQAGDGVLPAGRVSIMLARTERRSLRRRGARAYVAVVTSPSASVPGLRASVLLVEDDEVIGAEITRGLTAAGLAVTWSRTGRPAERGLIGGEADVLAHCRERLAPFEVPASFQVADELPHTAKGSVDRRAVAERFGQ